MKHHRLYRWLFLAIVAIILFSPLFYWLSGIGQAAANLSAEMVRLPDGIRVSSPKAEAFHSLTLPMRIQRMLIYPLLLFSFQFSGGSLALRQWLEEQVIVKTRRNSGELKGTHLSSSSKFLRVPFIKVPWSDLLIILLFILIFETSLALLYLPFNFYRGFIMAHQFGLSTQTTPGWMTDWLKSLFIYLVLEGVTWTGLYALMRWLPRRWPIPAGALLMLFGAVLVLLEPILITPLFYEVRPLEDSALRARILALADRAQMRVEAVEVIDASAKTTTANAYFSGFGGAQRIVLYDTLLRDYTPDQLEVVLAHEMGHWYYQHVLLATLGAGAAGWLGLFGLQWLLNRTWSWLGLSGPADIAGLPFVLAVIAIVSILTLPIENGISRLAERQADQFALATSQNPPAMIELFEQFAVQNLSQVDAPEWEKFLFYTHPSISERIGMAETWSETANHQ
jgi:STE24 endopeptidase